MYVSIGEGGSGEDNVTVTLLLSCDDDKLTCVLDSNGVEFDISFKPLDTDGDEMTAPSDVHDNSTFEEVGITLFGDDDGGVIDEYVNVEWYDWSKVTYVGVLLTIDTKLDEGKDVDKEMLDDEEKDRCPEAFEINDSIVGVVKLELYAWDDVFVDTDEVRLWMDFAGEVWCIVDVSGFISAKCDVKSSKELDRIP